MEDHSPAITKEQFPTLPKNILDALEKLIPNKCPNLLDTEREVWYNVGRRSVVDLLRESYAIQNERSLEI